MFGGVTCTAKLANLPLQKDIDDIYANVDYVSMRVSIHPELQGRKLRVARIPTIPCMLQTDKCGTLGLGLKLSAASFQKP